MVLCSYANRPAIGESTSRYDSQRSLAGACSRHRAGKQRHFQLELSGWPAEFAGKFPVFQIAKEPRHSSEVAGSHRQTLQGMGGGTLDEHKEFQEANRRGQEMLATIPHAVSARYHRRIGRVVVRLSTGLEISFSPRDAQGAGDGHMGAVAEDRRSRPAWLRPSLPRAGR